MTIKEVEEKVGIKKTNIRFYEEAGLLKPERSKENNYRIYSQTDVDILEKIKFLRSLGISVEDIRRLEQEKISFKELMDQHVQKLQKEKEEKEKSLDICQELSRSDQTFLNLNPAVVCAEDIWQVKGGDVMRTDRIRQISKLQEKDKKIVDFIETISAVFLGLSIVLMGSGYRWPVWVTIGAAAVMIGAHVVRCRIRSKIHGLQK